MDSEEERERRGNECGRESPSLKTLEIPFY